MHSLFECCATNFLPIIRSFHTPELDGIKWLNMCLLREHREGYHLAYFPFIIKKKMLLMISQGLLDGLEHFVLSITQKWLFPCMAVMILSLIIVFILN